MYPEKLPFPWTDADIRLLSHSTGFDFIAHVALDVLARFGEPVAMVSGPMTTGGKGSLEENLKAYQKAIQYLAGRGIKVFDQLPANERFVKHWNEWRRTANTDYCWEIFHQFYEPVFRSGMIRGLYFMPDWQSSVGATHERRLALAIPLRIEDLPLDWEQKFELAAV